MTLRQSIDSNVIPESSGIQFNWTPAYAGVTKWPIKN